MLRRPTARQEAQPQTDAKSNTLGTRKRAALGDVTNNARPSAAAKASAATKPEKPAVRRSRPTTTSINPPTALPRPNLRSKTTSRLPAAAKSTKSSTTTTTSTTTSNSLQLPLDVQDKPAKRLKTGANSHVTISTVSSVPKDAGWEDLDKGEEDDPLMVSSYVVEIYDYLVELEKKSMADPKYMDKQDLLNWTMRGILMDWLVEIHGRFRLLPETIFLAANIVDRFLSVRAVTVEKFQLVGAVALFIAAKYEEVVCPSIRNFLYMTDQEYEESEFIKAERYMLSVIDFDLSYPNPINFLRRISKADSYDIQTRTIAKYLLEISVVDHNMLSSPPSVLAAAAMWFARKVLNCGTWNPTLIHYSGYTQEELLPTAQLMLDYILRPYTEDKSKVTPQHPQLHRKYSCRKFYKASDIVLQWARKKYIKPGSKPGSVSRLEEWDTVSS